MEPIEETSRLYREVGAFSEGSCIVFSARNLEPPGMSSEQSKVCDTDELVVDLTRFAPCAP